MLSTSHIHPTPNIQHESSSTFQTFGHAKREITGQIQFGHIPFCALPRFAIVQFSSHCRRENCIELKDLHSVSQSHSSRRPLEPFPVFSLKLERSTLFKWLLRLSTRRSEKVIRFTKHTMQAHTRCNTNAPHSKHDKRAKRVANSVADQQRPEV